MIISLLGFMGSGKSSIGRRLAKELGWPCIDLDDYIVEKEKMEINAIFREYGEEYFRELETKHLKSIVESAHDIILALGGGAPCTKENWNYLEKTRSVYLKRSEEYLFDNLKEKKAKRPLIKEMNDDQLRELIATKLAEREGFYNQAEFVIDITLSKRMTAETIAMCCGAESLL